MQFNSIVRSRGVKMGDRLNLERQEVTLRAKSRVCAPSDPDPFSTSVEGLVALILQYSALLSSPPPPSQSASSVSSVPIVGGRDSGVSLSRSVDPATCSKVVEEVVVVSHIPIESMTQAGRETGRQEGAIVDLTCSDDEEDFSQIFSNDNRSSKNQASRGNNNTGNGSTGNSSTGNNSTGNKEARVGNLLAKSRGGSSTKKGSKSVPRVSEVLGEKPGSWACSSCTFVNPALVKFCDVCLLPFSKSQAKVPTASCDGLLDSIDGEEMKVKEMTKMRVDVMGKVTSDGNQEASASAGLKRKRVTAGAVNVTDMSKAVVVHSIDDDYQAPCSPSMKRKSTDIRANLGDDEISTVEIKDVMNDNLPEPLPICAQSLSVYSSDFADSPIDVYDPIDLSLQSPSPSPSPSASASPSPSRRVIKRFHAFGYQYPKDSLEHTDLILLKLDGGHCEEGISAWDCGIERCSTLEDKSIVMSTASSPVPVPVAVTYNTTSSRCSSGHSSNDVNTNNSCSGDSSNIDGSYTVHPHSLSQWQWAPLSCEVFGKRYGDPKRKGKSKFCGTCLLLTLDSDILFLIYLSGYFSLPLEICRHS
jgi:hypothetical protein